MYSLVASLSVKMTIYIISCGYTCYIILIFETNFILCKKILENRKW